MRFPFIKYVVLYPVLYLFPFLIATSAYGHKPSDSFLNISADDAQVTLQWDIALVDLEIVMGVDRNSDKKITWGELKFVQEDLVKLASQSLEITSTGTECFLDFVAMKVNDHTDGAYASLFYQIDCPVAPLDSLAINYFLFFDFDAQHRGLLSLVFKDNRFSYIYTTDNRSKEFNVDEEQNSFAIFLIEGINHIFTGLDHLLFIVALLLPAVFVRKDKKWQPAPNLRKVIVETLKVVTAFTVAHSVTLAMTTFSIVTAPSARLAHGAVALTIIFTALNNLKPVLDEKRWLMGFAFGLVHGIGYASVLTDLGFSGWQMALPLLGFNLGVEVAQVVIILATVPIGFWLRKRFAYQFFVFKLGSIATLIFASLWFVEQVIDYRFMPF